MANKQIGRPKGGEPHISARPSLQREVAEYMAVEGKKGILGAQGKGAPPECKTVKGKSHHSPAKAKS